MYFCHRIEKQMKEQAEKIYLISREMVLNPNGFWASLSEKEKTSNFLLKGLLMPLVMVYAFAVLLGEFFSSDYFRLWLGLLWVLREVFLVSVLYYCGVFATNKVLERTGFKQNETNLKILVVYSLLPFLIVSILTNFLPFFRFLDSVGFYGFYIFWLGSKTLLYLPEEKRDNITLKIIVANWIVFALLSFTTSKLLIALD